MKNSILTPLIVFMLLLFSTSCDKNNNDDDDTNTGPSEPTYYVEHDGTKYEVTQCYAFHQTMWSGLDHEIFKVVMVPDDITYDSFMEDLMGSGHGFTMDIATESVNSIAGTHFEIDTTNSSSAAWEILSAGIVFDDSFGIYSGIDIEMKKGNCVVSNLNNGNYSITGSFITNDGKNVTIKYNGYVRMLQMK